MSFDLKKVKLEEWILAGLLVYCCLLFPFEWGRFLVQIKKTVVSIGVVLIYLLMWKSKQLKIPKDIPTISFMLFVLYNFLSFFWATNSSLIWIKSVDWLLLLLIYISIRSINTDQWNYQFWKYTFLLIVFINTSLLLYFFIDIGYQNGEYLLTYEILKPQYIFNTNGNYISAFLVMIIPVLGYIYEKEKDYWSLFLLIVNILIVLLFNSRASTLALISIFLLYLIYNRRTIGLSRYLGFIILIGSLFLVFTFLFIQNVEVYFDQYNPFRTILEKTGDERLIIWEKTLLLFKDNPIFGVGSSNWKISYLQYGLDDFRSMKVYQHSHNLILELLAELGVIGFMIFIIFAFYPIKLFFLKKNKNLLDLMLMVGILVYFIVSSFYGAVYCMNNLFVIHQSLWIIYLALFLKINKLESFKINGNILIPVVFLCSLMISFLALKKYQYFLFNTFSNRTNRELQLTKIDNIYQPYLLEFINNKHILFTKSNLLWKLGDHEKAIDIMNECLEFHPYDYKNWIQLGDMYFETKNYALAKNAYFKSIDLFSKDYDAKIGLAKIALFEKDWKLFDESIAIYYEKLEPHIEKFYKETNWDSQNIKRIRYWERTCSFQDQFLDLIITGQQLIHEEKKKNK